MAFPSTTTATTTGFSTSVTVMAVNLPASIVSGQLLVAVVETRNTTTWTKPTGWSQIGSSQAGGGAVGQLSLFYRICDGTEGSTATWTAGTGTTAAWHTRLISSWDGTTPPEATTTSGDATSANPPSLTPSWGSADTLWFAIAGSAANNTGSFTAAPTNYTDFVNTGTSSGGSISEIATSYRQLTATSEDPGTFTVAFNRFWTAATIAVKPAAGGGGGGGTATGSTLLSLGIG